MIQSAGDLMNFIGIDFGWEGKPSGLAALSWNGSALELRATCVKTDTLSILEWLHHQVGDDDAMVAVDAPLVIANPTV